MMVKQSFVSTHEGSEIKTIPALLRLNKLYGDALYYLEEITTRAEEGSYTNGFIAELSAILEVHNDGVHPEWIKDLKRYECSYYTLVHLSKKIASLQRQQPLNVRHFEELFLDIVGRARYDQACNTKSLFEYPPAMQVELSKACNLKCPFCYQANDDFKKSIIPKQAFMEIEFFKRVIDASRGRVPYIILASRGEPLMHPQFSEMIEYLHDGFLDVKLNTNGMYLTEELCSLILDHVDTIVISVDSHEKDVYESLRVNADFVRLIGNLELLRDVRNKHPRKEEITVRISGVSVPWAEQDYEAFRKFFQDYADDVVLVQYIPWEKIYQLQASEASTSPCSELWTMLYVWSDGTINCCDVDNMSTLVGKPLDMSCSDPISVAWMSPAMQRLREIHIAGDRESLTPCNVCPN